MQLLRCPGSCSGSNHDRSSWSAIAAVRSEALFQESQTQKRRSSRLLGEGRYDEATGLLRASAAALDADALTLPEEFRGDLIVESGVMRAMAAEVDAGFADRAAKSASYDGAMKSRLRGRQAAGSQLLMRRADGGDSIVIDEWRLQPLRRIVQAAGLSARKSKPNGADVAKALAAGLSAGDQLQGFFDGAARHGGFTIETA